MLLIASLVQAASDCGFREALASTHRWGELSADAFREATNGAVAALACLDGAPLSAAEVAALHTAVARVAWLDAQAQLPGAASREEWSLRGLATVAPGPVPPPLDQDPSLVAAASTTPRCGVALARGSWTVNAAPSGCLPDIAAAVVQRAGGQAWYTIPGAAPPELRRHRSLGLGLAAGASALAGGALLAGAAATRGEFLDTADAAEARVLDSANLGLGLGGYGLLAAGGALGTWAIVEGEW